MIDRIDTRDLDEDENDVKELFEELRNCCDDPYDGIQMIAVKDWVEYTKQLIEECGYLDIIELTDKNDWPYRHITFDYEAAAEELESDYSEVTFRGTDYYYRQLNRVYRKVGPVELLTTKEVKNGRQ